MTVRNWHADVEVSWQPGVVVPANAVATRGTDQPAGLDASAAQCAAGSSTERTPRTRGTIPLSRSSTYPSTEQTLSSLSAVVNGGGLGQIGDIIHNVNDALSGREDQIRSLLTRLDNFVGTSTRQRDEIVATIEGLNRLAATIRRPDVRCSPRRCKTIPPALDVLVRERPAHHRRHSRSSEPSATWRAVGERHPGRLGAEPPESGPTLRCACRRRTGLGRRAGLCDDRSVHPELHRPCCPRRLRQPVRRVRYHHSTVEAGTVARYSLGARSAHRWCRHPASRSTWATPLIHSGVARMTPPTASRDQPPRRAAGRAGGCCSADGRGWLDADAIRPNSADHLHDRVDDRHERDGRSSICRYRRSWVSAAYTVTLELPASAGLYRFGNVTFRGVQIGKVTEVVPTVAAPRPRSSWTPHPEFRRTCRPRCAVSRRSASSTSTCNRERTRRRTWSDGSVIAMRDTVLPQQVGPMLDQAQHTGRQHSQGAAE